MGNAESALSRHNALKTGLVVLALAAVLAASLNISEKTGPHFAVGDTCYSYEEDLKSYNPDGKAIVARSNDYADLRDSEPDKAYFHCHTDITIPYDELEGVYAVMMDGGTICLFLSMSQLAKTNAAGNITAFKTA